MSNIRMTTKPPRAVRWSKQTTPLGPVLAGMTEEGAVCRLHFLGKQKTAAVLKAWQRAWPGTTFVEDKRAAKSLVRKIFGKDKVKVHLVGTAFQKSVWKALLDVPSGKVVSYADLARRLRKPNAARAVGNALGANPVPILVPCHRVIASGGRLGGFSAGLEIKKRLLKEENAKASMG